MYRWIYLHAVSLPCDCLCACLDGKTTSCPLINLISLKRTVQKEQIWASGSVERNKLVNPDDFCWLCGVWNWGWGSWVESYFQGVSGVLRGGCPISKNSQWSEVCWRKKQKWDQRLYQFTFYSVPQASPLSFTSVDLFIYYFFYCFYLNYRNISLCKGSSFV